MGFKISFKVFIAIAVKLKLKEGDFTLLLFEVKKKEKFENNLHFERIFKSVYYVDVNKK